MSYEFNVEKIERLEAELADEKAKKKAHAIEVRRLREKVTALLAELAAWQRHGVKVTEDCETCGGSRAKVTRGGDWVTMDGRTHFGDSANTPQWKKEPCPDCGGTGKKPRDGAWRWNLSGEHGDEPTVLFPAEWLEATDTPCRAHDSAVDDEGNYIGDCTLPRGHDGWHREERDGVVLAEWRVAHGHRREATDV